MIITVTYILSVAKIFCPDHFTNEFLHNYELSQYNELRPQIWIWDPFLAYDHPHIFKKIPNPLQRAVKIPQVRDMLSLRKCDHTLQYTQRATSKLT